MRIHKLRNLIPLMTIKRTSKVVREAKRNGKVVTFTPAQIRAINRSTI